MSTRGSCGGSAALTGLRSPCILIVLLCDSHSAFPVELEHPRLHRLDASSSTQVSYAYEAGSGAGPGPHGARRRGQPGRSRWLALPLRGIRNADQVSLQTGSLRLVTQDRECQLPAASARAPYAQARPWSVLKANSSSVAAECCSLCELATTRILPSAQRPGRPSLATRATHGNSSL